MAAIYERKTHTAAHYGGSVYYHHHHYYYKRKQNEKKFEKRVYTSDYFVRFKSDKICIYNSYQKKVTDARKQYPDRNCLY